VESPLVYTLPHLEAVEGLSHGFFARLGGTSPPPFASLNMGVATGDSQANVRANREIVRQALGLKRLAAVRQVHGDRIAAVNDGLPEDPLHPLAEADGMVTGRQGIGLLIKVADCVSILLCDPSAKSIGAVHAGWQGLVKGVIGQAVEAMAAQLNSHPARMLAGIGPCLGPCCAEFVNYRREFPTSLWKYKDGRDHFDLPAMARDQLIEAGLFARNIQTLTLCTRCREDLFFSHRGQGTATGRLAAVIGFRVERGRADV